MSLWLLTGDLSPLAVATGSLSRVCLSHRSSSEEEYPVVPSSYGAFQGAAVTNVRRGLLLVSCPGAGTSCAWLGIRHSYSNNHAQGSVSKMSTTVADDPTSSYSRCAMICIGCSAEVRRLASGRRASLLTAYITILNPE